MNALKTYFTWRTLLTMPGMAVLLVCWAGCATSPTAYKTFASIGYAVDAAMTVAAEAKADGHLSDDQWLDLSLRHEQYRVVYRAGLIAAQMDTKAIASPQVQDLAAELVRVINVFVIPTSP